MKTLIVLFISAFSITALSAQDYYHWISFAEGAVKDNDLLGAVIYYENAFQLDSSKQELQYALAEAYKEAGHYSESERLFMKIYSKGRGRFFPEGPAHIAQLKMYNAEYEAAIEFWRRAMRRTDKEDEKLLYEQKMRSCSFALSNPIEDEDIEVIRLGEEINTKDSEYGTEWSGDSLLFFSSLRGKVNAQYELESPDDYYSRIYTSTADVYGYSEGHPIHITGADSLLHHLHPTLSPDGERLFFSMCSVDGHCDIAIAERNGNSFEFIHILEEEYSDKGSNSQPFFFTIDQDDFLLFSSTRSGGFGGFDLWVGKIKGANLNDIRNLGPDINSPGNEVTAYYDTDKKQLYFSSDWHPGHGDYDVFTTKWVLGSESKISLRNLGLPINSPVKDIYYKEVDSGRYITSNRAGSISMEDTYCCTDLYEIKAIETDTATPVIAEVPESIENVDELKGLLPISLYFHNDIPDPGSLSNSTQVDYEKTVSDYLKMEEKYLDRYSDGRSDSIGMSAKKSMEAFFEDRVRSEYQKLEGVSRLIYKELEKGLKIEIAIKGYASPLAESDYNRKLTQRRITSVINYLKELDDGILRKYMNGEFPELKVRAIPYGEEKSDSYVSDNPQDAKNSIYSIAAMRERRVEILRITQLD